MTLLSCSLIRALSRCSIRVATGLREGSIGLFNGLFKAGCFKRLQRVLGDQNKCQRQCLRLTKKPLSAHVLLNPEPERAEPLRICLQESLLHLPRLRLNDTSLAEAMSRLPSHSKHRSWADTAVAKHTYIVGGAVSLAVASPVIMRHLRNIRTV